MINQESRKALNPKVQYRKFIPMAHKILVVFAGLIILIGIVESMFFFNLNIVESLILAIILLLFYAILLFFLLQPKTVKIIKHSKPYEKPAIQTISEKIANEIDKATEIKITKPAITSSRAEKKTVKKKVSKKKKAKKKKVVRRKR